MMAAQSGHGARESDLRERLERIRLARISTPLASLLSMLITLPSFLTRVPGGMVGRTLRTAPVAIVALLGGVLGAWAPIPGLPTELSVFVPVMILAPVAVARLGTVRT
jgi:hypothetical protein